MSNQSKTMTTILINLPDPTQGIYDCGIQWEIDLGFSLIFVITFMMYLYVGIILKFEINRI